MAVTDWIQTAAVIYFAWQQNRIFQRQNEIFANQAGHTAMPKTSQMPWITRYWPTMVMVGLVALTGYDIYARRGALPLIPWWFYALLLLIGAVVGLVGRLDEITSTKQKTAEQIALNKQLEGELLRCRQIRDGALTDARTAKERIAELEAQLAKAVASWPSDNSLQGTVTSDPWLSLLHSRQELEAELQELVKIEEVGIKIIPRVKIGKDEGDYRRERIEVLKRDIGEISKRLDDLTKHKVPDITGEILHARRPMRIAPYKGQETSMVLLKVRVSTKTEIATIRRANLTVESNGKKYEGKKQPIEIEPVTFHHQFGPSQEEQPFDLVDRVAKEPLRRGIGTPGWLQFLVDGLPDGVGTADLYLTLTDDLGGEHLISAKSFSID